MEFSSLSKKLVDTRLISIYVSVSNYTSLFDVRCIVRKFYYVVGINMGIMEKKMTEWFIFQDAVLLNTYRNYLKILYSINQIYAKLVLIFQLFISSNLPNEFDDVPYHISWHVVYHIYSLHYFNFILQNNYTYKTKLRHKTN